MPIEEVIRRMKERAEAEGDDDEDDEESAEESEEGSEDESEGEDGSDEEGSEEGSDDESEGDKPVCSATHSPPPAHSHLDGHALSGRPASQQPRTRPHPPRHSRTRAPPRIAQAQGAAKKQKV